MTPGTWRSRGEICQSRMVRSSIRLRPAPFTWNWKISPSPVEIGPICGMPDSGGTATEGRREKTRFRAA